MFDKDAAFKALELASGKDIPFYEIINLAKDYYCFLTGKFSLPSQEVTNADQAA